MSRISADRDTAFLLANNFPILYVLSSNDIERLLKVVVVICLFSLFV
jgi:hypothetical protein